MRLKRFFYFLFAFFVVFSFTGMPAGVSVQAVPIDFDKLTPTDNNMNVPTSGVVLSWTASSEDVAYEYCLRPNNQKKCPGNKWIKVGTNTSVTLGGLTPDKNYSWQVRAVSNVDSTITEADNGVWWSFRTVVNPLLPGAFGKLTPPDLTVDAPLNGLSLTWSASTNATSYQYCVDTVNDNVCNTTWISTGTILNTVLNGLLYNQVYYWQVRALNAAGNIEADGAEWWDFKTVITPPQAFNKKAPANNTPEQPTSLTLEWDPSAGDLIEYEYCYDTTGGSTCNNTINWTSAGTATSAVISGLSYETTYAWQIRAKNPSGVVQANGGLFWTFSTIIAPPASFGKSAPADDAFGQPLNPTLSWEASAGQNITYEYCYTDTPAVSSCDKLWQQALDATQVNLSGLKYNTVYSWQVRAVNSSGSTYADGGTLWQFTTQVAPPSPFSKLTPTDADTGQPVSLYLTWSPSTNAVDYLYCVDTVDNDQCDQPSWEVSSGTSAALIGLNLNTEYFWQVKARNTQGETGANNGTWWSFTTMASTPSGFSKLSPMDTNSFVSRTPWLYWTVSSGATGYEYCIHTSATCPTEGDWVDAGTNLSIQVPMGANLLSNSTYYWQVRSVNGGSSIEANSSAWWSFTTLKDGPTSTNQTFNDAQEDQTYHNSLQATSNYGKTFSLAGSPPPGILVLAANGSFSYTPPADFAGPVSFDFIVSDGYNPPSPSYQATIEVAEVNDAPILNLISDKVIKSGETVSFTISAQDVDIPYGDTLTLQILELLPSGATFNPLTGLFHWEAYWSPTHPQPYSFTVEVSDGDLTDSQVFQITITPVQLFLPQIGKQP